MDFSKLLTDKTKTFSEDGYYVWCGSMFAHGGKYYLAYSRWKRELGFGAWVTDSEICLARADSPMGDFSYIKTLRTKDDDGKWDSSCAHNPTVIFDGKFYRMFYMGNRGNGDWWTHRNSQRIGEAFTDDPEDKWHFSDKPVIDVSENGFDSLMVSNPTATMTPDGGILMVYKGVSKDGVLPKGGDVVCGVAFADKPGGDFRKAGIPIMVNPENGWSVEDPFIWREEDRYFALVKDFQGYFTRTGDSSTALFESSDGFDWHPSEHPLAFERRLCGRRVNKLERPQIFFENGKPSILLCACAVDDDFNEVFSTRIKLRITEENK